MPRLSRTFWAWPSGYSARPSEGNALQSLQFFQTEDALNLDLQFQSGISLELIFRVGFQASARLLEFRNGDSRSQNSQAETARISLRK